MSGYEKLPIENLVDDLYKFQHRLMEATLGIGQVTLRLHPLAIRHLEHQAYELRHLNGAYAHSFIFTEGRLTQICNIKIEVDHAL